MQALRTAGSGRPGDVSEWFDELRLRLEELLMLKIAEKPAVIMAPAL